LGAIVLVRLLMAPYWLDREKQEQISRLEQHAADIARTDVEAAIAGVVFDPNGPTEMYVDLTVYNHGPPTIIENWLLSISVSGVTTSNLSPRAISTDRTIARNTFQSRLPFMPVAETLAEQPLEQGGKRKVHLVFTFTGQDAKSLYDKVGAVFSLRANDVKGRVFGAEYVYPGPTVAIP
jgi:hypothetical protein